MCRAVGSVSAGLVAVVAVLAVVRPIAALAGEKCFVAAIAVMAAESTADLVEADAAAVVVVGR